ncbi:hypothetical protein [Arthrobacter sedimenti]|uniref:hypothetical protein n=1 Tax=Arthrobacter sedimenti TaxID=2694931 RepID=UPI000B352789|nr:hypothetical protein [Arthrobacter sedimenti]OUM41050.1 hypothetical protein B8W73_11885 [Arthrobacter agilis]
MNKQESTYIDGAFAIELCVQGEDEHGLPLLDVTLYPAIASQVTNAPLGSGYAADFRYVMGGITVPLEETGLTKQELASMPLCDGWTVISYCGAGLRAHEVSQVFGVRAAIVILSALSDALLSESINEDDGGSLFRPGEDLLTDDWDHVCELLQRLQDQLEAENQREEVSFAFFDLIQASYGDLEAA